MMNSISRITLIAVCSLLVSQLENRGTARAPDAESGDNGASRGDTSQNSDLEDESEWGSDHVALHWPHFGLIGEADQEIKRATLRFQQGAFSTSWAYLTRYRVNQPNSPGEAIVIELPDDLRSQVGSAFDMNGSLCYAKSIHAHGATGATQRLGSLEIERRNGEIIHIGINTFGFSMGEEPANFDNTFFSGFLSELIDDACFTNSGQHLPEEWKETLSGLTEVMESKRAYRSPLN